MQCMVSVILCTYNRAALLPRMLDSIQAQTLQDYELILINNGSEDDTQTICEQYAAKNSHIRLFTLEKNQGAARGRNFGLEQAKGKYILMVDDDDYCCPDMLKVLYDLAEKYQADISVVGCRHVYEDGTKDVYVYPEEYVFTKAEGVSAFLQRKLYNTGPGTKLFRRTLFQDLRWIEGTLVDDIHFIYRLFVAADRVVCYGNPLYHKYKHGKNMTSFLSGDLLTAPVLQEYLYMQDERVEYITAKIPELSQEVRYARVSYMISMVERIETGSAIGCEQELQYMKHYLQQHSMELLDTPWVTQREINLMKLYVNQ